MGKSLDEMLDEFVEQSKTPKLSGLEGFGQSALWAFPEMLGVRPPLESGVPQWRAEHPVGSFGSQALSWLVPYAGWAKAASSVPKLGPVLRGLETGQKMAEAPFKTRALTEAVRYSPLEAARVGAGLLAGETLAEEIGGEYMGGGALLGQAALDLTLGSGIGGTIQKIGSAGLRKKVTESVPGININQPAQKVARDLKAKLAEVGEEHPLSPRLHGFLSKQFEAIRKQTLREYVYGGDGDKARQLNRLFKPGEGPAFSRKLFVSTGKKKGTFHGQSELKAALEAAGIADKLEKVQTPRWLETKGRGARKNLEKTFKRTLEGVDSSTGWRYGVDPEDGLYIMARKVDVPEVGVPAAPKGPINLADVELDDFVPNVTPRGTTPQAWVLFKTDSPGDFMPGVKAFADRQLEFAGRFASRKGYRPHSQDANAPTVVSDTILRFDEAAPIIEFRGVTGHEGHIRKLMDRLGFSAIRDNAFVDQLFNVFKHTVATKPHQFRHSPTARHVLYATALGKTAAEAHAQRLFQGGKVVGQNTKSVLGALFTSGKVDGQGFPQLVDEVFKSQSEWQGFSAAWRELLSAEEAVAKLGLAENGPAVKLLRSLDSVDDLQNQGIKAVQEIFGKDSKELFIPLKHHRLISRTWKGPVRVQIKEGHRTVGYASGLNNKAAEREAKEIVEQGVAEGKQWSIGRKFNVTDQQQEMDLLKTLNEADTLAFGAVWQRAKIPVKQPKRMVAKRTGARFFEGDVKDLDPEFVKRAIFKQLRDYQLYQASSALHALYKSDLEKLAGIDPMTAEALKDRINDAFGIQGRIAKTINEYSDKALKGVMGPNSASKIINATNAGMFRLTFGFVNTGFNVANLLTFVQTSMPQLAYLASAAPERIAKDYTFWPVIGEKAQATGLGMLDAAKLLGKSFYKMGAGMDDQLRRHVERALAEGAADPKFVEEWVGQNATKLRHWKEALSGRVPFSDFIYAVADAMPSATEKLARGHSFVLGHTFFKETLGVTDDELLYQLSKQFTEKTQFLYGTEDRSQIFTGPIGGGLGLFKTWMMNYMGWMARYTGEGVQHGNWKPLLWMTAGTTAVGGVGGLAGYTAADTASRWFTDEGLMEHIYGLWGGDRESATMSDVVYMGLPAFLGFSIQNQVAMPGQDPGEDAVRMMNFVYLDRMKYAAKAFGSAIDSWQATGQSPVRDQETVTLMARAFAPKFVYRSVQAAKDEMLRSVTTGYPVTELTLGERLWYASGVNPRWLETRFAVGRELWRNQEKMRNAVSQYGKELYEAQIEGDHTAATIITYRAMAEGVDVSSIWRSARVRMSKGREEAIERQFSPEEVLKWKALGL